MSSEEGEEVRSRGSSRSEESDESSEDQVQREYKKKLEELENEKNQVYEKLRSSLGISAESKSNEEIFQVFGSIVSKITSGKPNGTEETDGRDEENANGLEESLEKETEEEAKRNELRQALVKAKRVCEAIEKEYEWLKGEYAELERTKRDQDEKIMDLEKALDQKKTQETEKGPETSTAELQEAQEANKALESKNRALMARIELLEAENKEKEEKNLIIEKEKEDLEGKAKDSQREIERLKAEIESLGKTVRDLKDEAIEAEATGDKEGATDGMSPKHAQALNSGDFRNISLSSSLVTTIDSEVYKEAKAQIEKLEKEKEELSRSLQMRIEGNQELFKKISCLEGKLSDKEIHEKAQEILGKDYPEPEELSLSSLFNALKNKLEEVGFMSGIHADSTPEAEEPPGKLKIEKDAQRRLESLFKKDPISPGEVTIIGLIDHFEKTIRNKDQELFIMANEIDKMREQKETLEEKLGSQREIKTRYKKRKSQMKELKDELDLLKFKFVNNEENECPYNEMKKAFMSIMMECRLSLSAEDFSQFLKKIKAVSVDLADFIKEELANSEKLDLIKPYFDKLGGSASSSMGSYSTLMMIKRTEAQKKKNSPPRSNTDKRLETKKVNSSGSDKKEGARTQPHLGSSQPKPRTVSPFNKGDLSASPKNKGTASLKRGDQKKNSQDDLLARKISELEEENKKLKLNESSLKAKLDGEKQAVEIVQTRLSDLEETVKAIRDTKNGEQLTREVEIVSETISKTSPKKGQGYRERIMEKKQENLWKSQKKASPFRLKPGFTQNTSKEDEFSFSGIASSHDSSFSFEVSRQSKAKSFAVDNSNQPTQTNKKVLSKSPNAVRSKKNIFLDTLPLNEMDLSTGLLSGRSSKGTGILKPNLEAVVRIKNLFRSSWLKPMNNAVLFVKETLQSGEQVPQRMTKQQQSPRFRGSSSSPTSAQVPHASRINQKAPIYSFSESALYLGEDHLDENPVPIPFEQVFFSYMKEEASEHFKSLIETNQHNYIAVFGGNRCGVSGIAVEIMDLLVSVLIRTKKWIENQKVSLVFINSSLRKENLQGSFLGRSQLKKNEISISLAQLEAQPSLFQSVLFAENKRPGAQSAASSSFLQIAFKYEKEMSPRSFTILLLRKFRPGVVDDSSVAPGIQRIISRSLLELRPMASSYYRNQKVIEEVVKRYLDLSKVSIIFCMNSSNGKIQETLHTLSIYSTMGSEKRNYQVEATALMPRDESKEEFRSRGSSQNYEKPKKKETSPLPHAKKDISPQRVVKRNVSSERKNSTPVRMRENFSKELLEPLQDSLEEEKEPVSTSFNSETKKETVWRTAQARPVPLKEPGRPLYSTKGVSQGDLKRKHQGNQSLGVKSAQKK